MSTDARSESADTGREEPAIVPARKEDIPAIAALLRAAELPHEDFVAHIDHFLVARRGGLVIGAVGAEVHGTDALLRSLVVSPDARGAGVGGRLVSALEQAAAAWGVERWWLLTTTAETFFTRRGFAAEPRANAPAGIANTAQFSGLCSSVARCLSRERRTA